jgi:hypothetical protein
VNHSIKLIDIVKFSLEFRILPYMIDGHNLIPHIPGLSLSNLDDEKALVAYLQVFCRVKRRKVEVFFDGAEPGYSGNRHHGTVVAHYIRRGIPADLAMIDLMKKIGRSASNWTIVSSDHLIQTEARSMHFRCVNSNDFAQEIIELQSENPATSLSRDDLTSGGKDIEEWLEIFGGEK